MTNQNNTAPAATANPLSDEYVNAVIQQHGYQSPESVIAQLAQWIGLHGGQDSVTLLMYEAHRALSALRAPVTVEAVYTLRVRGAIQAWTPTAAPFSIPDGEHQLFLGPAAPPASQSARIIFPAHLRKMWSGGEVQAWLDEHQGVTAPKPSAKGSLERYRKWQAEQAEAKADGAPCSCPSGDGSLRHPCAVHSANPAADGATPARPDQQRGRTWSDS